ncbi:MAG TPA: RNA methyltransferase [Gemmatimonadales bacterium]|nr:RNA methyltransferase [Gemmatimonadales bacterium]
MRLLTLARDLRRRKAREHRGLFTIEGTRAVEELLDSPLRVHGALHESGYGGSERERQILARLQAMGMETLVVSEAELASASDTEQPQGIVAIARMPEHSLVELPDPERGRWLVLDAIQDPGNLGTIIRTAAAMGVSAVLALRGTVDVWNSKVVRSSMGASFRMPLVPLTVAELQSFLSDRGIPLWAADAGGEPVQQKSAPRRLALVVGNEGAGVSAEVMQLVQRRVAIPMDSAVESLNVAVATGILLYMLQS